MKKVYFMLLATGFMVATTFAQNIQRNVAKECVLFEVFTGVNCPYCPAAANGIGQMMDEGLKIAPIAYHTSAFSTPDFYTNETNARASFYGITSYPTLMADGKLSVAGGGGASQNMYSTYLGKYNQRIGIPSPYTIDLSYSHVSGTANHEVVCTVNQVGESAGNNLRIMIVLSQSNIIRSWQGMPSLHHVVRDMIPSQTGTVYNGGTQTVTATFSLGSLPQEDCFITAWIQDFTTKEVFQAVRVSMNAPDYPNDIALKSVTNVISNSCSGEIKPTIEVKNRGIFECSSLEVAVKIDGVECHRYQWTGTPFAYCETTQFDMPAFVLPNYRNQNIEFVVENPNGNEDFNLTGNSLTKTIEPAFESEGFIKIIFITDSKPQESSVEIINMETHEIIKTLTYADANTTYTDFIHFPAMSCYQVLVKDTGGDGLDKLMGLFDNEDNLIFKTGSAINQFTYEIAVEVTALSVNIDEIAASKLSISPNPSQGQFQITTDQSNSYPVVVFDVTGREVYRNESFSDGMIDLRHCTKGIYLIKVGSQTQKLLIY
ncbi:MAG: T9SS type A sorting domain-containing protein [Bacteroidales bacterium]|nr:T9SS type A sorting domain-containing protein [Bacteroidales bacterium]